MKVHPSNPFHARLQSSVEDALTNLGFIVDSSAYHDKMSADMARRLSRIDTPQAHYYRTRADRIAVHKDADCVFELEIKTGDKKYDNAVVEALPLAWHLANSRYNIRCLYVHAKCDDCYMYLPAAGWWAAPAYFPKFIVKVPPRRMHLIGDISALLQSSYEGRGGFTPKVIAGNETRGSNDPMAMISSADYSNRMISRPWEELVEEYLDLFRMSEAA